MMAILMLSPFLVFIGSQQYVHYAQHALRQQETLDRVISCQTTEMEAILNAVRFFLPTPIIPVLHELHHIVTELEMHPTNSPSGILEVLLQPLKSISSNSVKMQEEVGEKDTHVMAQLHYHISNYN